MPEPITPPKPGQLITVTFVTSILNKLTELEGRLASLEKVSTKDSSIVMNLGGISPPNVYDPITNTIKVPTTGVLVGITATFAQPGMYDITLVQVAPAAGWNPILTTQLQTPFPILPSEITPGVPAPRTPSVFITPVSGATPVSGTLEVHIKRQGASTDQFVSFKLTPATP